MWNRHQPWEDSFEQLEIPQWVLKMIDAPLQSRYSRKALCRPCPLSHNPWCRRPWGEFGTERWPCDETGSTQWATVMTEVDANSKTEWSSNGKFIDFIWFHRFWIWFSYVFIDILLTRVTQSEWTRITALRRDHGDLLSVSYDVDRDNGYHYKTPCWKKTEQTEQEKQKSLYSFCCGPASEPFHTRDCFASWHTSLKKEKQEDT